MGSTDELWCELHEQALKAATAAWAFARDHVRGEELPGSPHRHWGTVNFLKCDPGAGWGQKHIQKGAPQLYFAVDQAANPNFASTRMEITNPWQDGRFVYFNLPDETMERLSKIGSPKAGQLLRVFETNSEESLARRWVDAIESIDRGPQAADLWTNRPAAQMLRPQVQPDAQMTRTLNHSQQTALAAMTTPGGWFVWGPPGTGKTTVITQAVRAAIAVGHSVLVVSHAHVAVDNVLEGLIADDVHINHGFLQPGRVVRKTPGDRERVSDTVTAHDFLLDEKAAAVITNRDQRLSAIAEAEYANNHHPVRAREEELRDKVYDLDPLDNGIRQLDKQRPLYEELLGHEAERFALASQRDAVLPQIEAANRRLEAGLDVEESWQRLTMTLSSARNQAVEFRDHVDGIAKMLSEALAERDEFQRRLTVKQSGRFVLPWLSDKRMTELAELESLLQQMNRSVQELTAKHDQAEQQLAAIENGVSGLERLHTELTIRRDGLAETARDKKVLQNQYDSLIGEIKARTARIDEIKRTIGNPDEWLNRYRQAELDGSLDLVHEWEECSAQVQELGNELDDLSKQRDQVNDEYRKKRVSLMAEAPVIATTLDSLVYSPELLDRRFDVVIIDEVSSAEAAKVFYAVSKADRTCALVGDFMQNSPVADAETPITDEDRVTADWQTKDIFRLVGITDRASAERHPHCVALSVQYRYPPIIANAVNTLCYDGLLDTVFICDDQAISVVFHDTSGLAPLDFKRVDTSWECPRTLELAQEIARRETAGTVGFVTPYRAQARRAWHQFKTEPLRELGVECGTAHTFQGRERDVIILDLMQDKDVRWISFADAHSADDRALSAARLLNVALTRARRRLHLIGDWGFISNCQTPGMRVLAGLASHPGFQLVKHGSNANRLDVQP